MQRGDELGTPAAVSEMRQRKQRFVRTVERGYVGQRRDAVGRQRGEHWQNHDRLGDGIGLLRRVGDAFNAASPRRPYWAAVPPPNGMDSGSRNSLRPVPQRPAIGLEVEG